MAGSDKIKVLVVDDIAETREMIQRMLQFDGQIIEVIGTARTGREAIDSTVKLQPDVVLMDINMPDMDGIAATEAIHKKVPFVQVVILSVQNDPNYMRRAMLAGARDFLSKPPTIDDLTNAIRTAGKLSQDERSKGAAVYPGGVSGSQSLGGGTGPLSLLGKIITVYSPKGGVGCTSIATNLAIALKTNENKVALVDSNLSFGDVAVFLNEQGKNTILDLTPRADELDEEVIDSTMITHAGTGLKVLTAPPRPEIDESGIMEKFAKVLGYFRQIFAYTVIDTNSFLTESVQTALDKSDIIILVTTQGIPSIKNCNLFLKLMDASGIHREKILFLMNQYDKRITISPEKVGENLRQPIQLVIPFEEKTVELAVNRGVPFMIDNRATPVGKAILQLADVVKEKIAKIVADSEAAAPKPR